MFINRWTRISPFPEFLSILYFLVIFLKQINAQDPNCNFLLDVQPGRTYYIRSPNYAQNYYGENYCKWNIKSEYRINFRCDLFNIPPVYNTCQYDHMLVYENPSDSNKVPLRLCGNGTVSRNSEGREMVITFRSYYSTPGGIFSCIVEPLNTDQDDENCRCGWKNPSRIVGGTDAALNEYPMMVGIVDEINQQVFCGGAIISTKHVLTAAHCLKQKNANDLGVLIGDHDLSTGSDANSITLPVQKYVNHPSYIATQRNSDYDVSVMTVYGSIPFTNIVGPACLPFQHSCDGFGGSFVEFLGWGTTELSGATPNVLQKVEVSVINLSKCKKSYPKINEHQLCTLTPGKDACQFDSGGPVLWQNPTTKRLVIVGIVSYGVACGTKIPSVNTRVGAFLDWIQSVTEGVNYCRAE
ncbi:venom serine protease 34-like isoform X2 [Leptopilina heterotoma]|uniref:venom serine protease 34-like isoform X2 n=1 Tax=Leptopilina heterotoma TaxID=63436 RepID=UPI001CA88B43|nr:venom serine protease 34-like isoform X2 [Leptopilina heterotoma]